jgi:phosphoglycerate kinase
MNLPQIDQIDLKNKNVLVRVGLEDANPGSPRYQAVKDIIEYLQQHEAGRIKVIGHSGDITMALDLGVDVNWDLRADPREETNDVNWAKELALGFDTYINESFETSHRVHASIVALPQLMKSEGKPVAMGLRFAKEVEVLSNVFNAAGDVRVLVIGGTKVKDKNKYADQLTNKFTHILRGGLLEGSPRRPDGLDITPESVEKYKQLISTANLIVAAGVMGKYEDANAELGTKEVLTAITQSKAYKIAGGGDIETAISKYGLSDKFDWISVGGGAMLEFLVTGTLPGLKALLP